MPTCLSVGQAVFNDEANGKFDDGVRVIGFRRSKVGGVDGEMFLTLAAIMLGIVQNDFDGTTGDRITEVVDSPRSQGVSGAETTALWTSALFTGSGTSFNLWLWQIVGIDNSFGGVGNVLTGTGHARFLLEKHCRMRKYAKHQPLCQ